MIHNKSSIGLVYLTVRMSAVCLYQRDLDFTIDLDFHGQLSEVVESMHYKMR